LAIDPMDSKEFMNDLDYEGCYLMGLDSLLQVNEVYENFAEATTTTDMDDDSFNGESRKTPTLNRGNTDFHEVLDQNPDLVLASYHNELDLKRHNNLLDVITRKL
jgi:hypothetical protein